MSSISAVNSPNTPPPAPASKVGTDGDGDNDGSKGSAPVIQTPFVAKPTVTMGNNVNTTA
jgi:hypothetical protein